jgi:hypothetical protein
MIRFAVLALAMAFAAPAHSQQGTGLRETSSIDELARALFAWDASHDQLRAVPEPCGASFPGDLTTNPSAVGNHAAATPRSCQGSPGSPPGDLAAKNPP